MSIGMRHGLGVVSELALERVMRVRVRCGEAVPG